MKNVEIDVDVGKEYSGSVRAFSIKVVKAKRPVIDCDTDVAYSVILAVMVSKSDIMPATSILAEGINRGHSETAERDTLSLIKISNNS